MVTEVQTVQVPVEVFRPVPETLTEVIPYPPALTEGFTIEDVMETTFALFDLLDQANADRARVAELTTPPSPEGPPDPQ